MGRYRPGRIMRTVFRAGSRVYDWNLGWLFGNRMCRITHVGRKSGKTYRTPLEVVEVASSGEIVVVSGLGPKADWYRNVRASGTAEVEIGRRRFRASVREPDLDEATEIFTRYERRYGRLAPLVRRLLSKLVGWHYDGSDAARRKLAGDLPLVALTPS